MLVFQLVFDYPSIASWNWIMWFRWNLSEFKSFPCPKNWSFQGHANHRQSETKQEALIEKLVNFVSTFSLINAVQSVDVAIYISIFVAMKSRFFFANEFSSRKP